HHPVCRSECLLIALVVTPRSARDLQHQWYIAPTLGHIGGHVYLATLRKQGQPLFTALRGLYRLISRPPTPAPADAKSGWTPSCARRPLRSTLQLNSVSLPPSTCQTSAPGVSRRAPGGWRTPAGVSIPPRQVPRFDSSTATRFPLACTRWSARW